MIINHSKKFISFANWKTASTSKAITLSSSCNGNNVFTPLGLDEKIRRELCYQGPTNFIPWWNKINYFWIIAKSKIFKTNANRALKAIGLHRQIEGKLSLLRITSAHRPLGAVTASSLHTKPMGPFSSPVLNFKKTREYNLSI